MSLTSQTWIRTWIGRECCKGVGFTDWTCYKPKHWVFEEANVKKGDRVPALVGWEYHGAPVGMNPNLVVPSEGPVYGANGEKRPGIYATTIYAVAKGNLVFNAATCWWNRVLSSPPGFQIHRAKTFRGTMGISSGLRRTSLSG
jgi:hypothetical protein